MINKKNIEIGDKEYIIEQPSAIKALILSPVVARILRAIESTQIAAGEGVDIVEFEQDLNSFLYNRDLIKKVTGKSKNGLPTAKVISKDDDLPKDMEDLIPLIQIIVSFMFKVDIEADSTEEGPKEGK